MNTDLSRDQANDAGRMAYEAFSDGFARKRWEDMADHERFRWRLAARAVLRWQDQRDQLPQRPSRNAVTRRIDAGRDAA